MRKSIRLGRKSFTLIELMFGLAISLAVIIAALLSFMNCMFINESSGHIVIAANDAQYALEQIKTQSFSNIPAYIANYPSNRFNNLPNESISFPNSAYGSTLDTITVQINYNERNATRTFAITTCFAQ